MTLTSEQLASVIQRSVQELLTRGLNDPRIRGMISVTDVKVSDDLAHARISVSVLPEEYSARTMSGLQSATGYIRTHLGRTLTRRRVPQLSFRLDKSLKKQAAVHAAINRAIGERTEKTEGTNEPMIDDAQNVSERKGSDQ